MTAVDRRWEDRKRIGDEHEMLTDKWLTGLGWLVEPFGQALLTERARHALRMFRPDPETTDPTEARWIPDRLIHARINGRQHVRLVDAKGEREHTGNHTVEIGSLAAHLLLQAAWRIPVWYVFPDGRCIDADDLNASKDKTRRRGAGVGRTDFWLFPGQICRPIDDGFRIGCRTDGIA